MPDQPYIIHFVPGSGDLLVGVAAPNAQAVTVLCFIRGVALKPGAEAFRVVKLVVVHLRLGVVVGRIRGPAPRLIEHLAHHQVGLRGVVQIKHSRDDPVPGAVPLTLAELLVQAVARVVEFRRPGAIVVGHLHQNLAVLHGGNRGLGTSAKVHGVGLLFKGIFASAGLVYAVAYGKGHLAG